jgi:molybdopterin adenylyltransferase
MSSELPRIETPPSFITAKARATCRVGIVTISDRASRGIYEDRSGPAIRSTLGRLLTTSWVPVERLVPDEWDAIEDAIVDLCDHCACSLVVTTGGTGPAPRDITPEVTRMLCDKELPGFGELMRAVSLKSVPTAILSRQTAGVRGKSLIINLPGKPTAIAECLLAVFAAVPYCLDLIGATYVETDPSVCRAFRPGQPVATN